MILQSIVMRILRGLMDKVGLPYDRVANSFPTQYQIIVNSLSDEMLDYTRHLMGVMDATLTQRTTVAEWLGVHRGMLGPAPIDHKEGKK